MRESSHHLAPKLAKTRQNRKHTQARALRPATDSPTRQTEAAPVDNTRTPTTHKNLPFEQQRDAQALEEMRQFLESILDAHSANTAVLASDGTIVKINAAWKRLGAENGSPSAQHYLGENYLAVCDQASGANSTEAARAAAGIRAVIEGRQDDFYLEYPCHSPTTQRWFGMRVTPFAEASPRRVVVAHTSITERIQVEEALRASEERFRRYFELGLIGMAITSPTKGFLEFNDQICAILGYERHELMDMSWAELTYPDDLAADVVNFNRILAGETDGYTLDKRWIRKDGQVIDTIISVKCMRRADGAVDHFVALLQDITERKRTATAERDQRRFAEAMRDSLAALTSSLDMDNVMQRILDAAHLVVPTDAGSIILFEGDEGRVAYLRGFTPEASAFLKDYHFPLESLTYGNMRANKQPYYVADTQAAEDWISVPVSDWIRSSAGIPIELRGELIGVLIVDSATPNHFRPTDIERLQAFARYASLALENADHVTRLEQRVAERTAEMQAAKERVEAILNNSLDGILVVNTDLWIQQTNRAFNLLFAVAPDDNFTGSLRDLIHLDDGQRMHNTVQRVIGEQTGDQVELRCYRKNGTVFDAELSISPIRQDGLVCTIRDITERKRIQNALAEERNLLRTLIDVLPDYIYVKDTNHRTVVSNAARARSFGLTPEETVGKDDFAFVPAELVIPFHADEDQLFQSGLPLVNREERTIGPNGDMIWASTTKVPLRNLDGALIGLVGITRDISEQKARERQLRYHASIQENVSDAVIVTDLDMRIQSWNKAAEVIYGWHANEAIGNMTFESLHTQYQANEVGARHWHAFSQKGRWQGEIAQKRKDGTEVYILGSFTLLKDEYGEPFGMVAVNHDITKRKRVEEALRASEARYRLLAENITDMVIRYDASGKFVYVSPSSRTLLGYEPQELLGQSGFDLVHPDEVATLREMHREALEHPTPSAAMTCRVRHREGHYIWMEFAAHLIYAETTGELLELIVSGRNVTERKRAEENLRAKTEEEREFQSYLKALHDITIELTAVDALDIFYRRAIELGLERLGFERLGLLLYDAEERLAVGTYGTDAQGCVIAEPHIRLEPASHTGILRRALEKTERFAFDEQAQLYSHLEPIGMGWNAAAVLWNGDENLGWLAADNGVRHQPVSKPRLEILALYSLALGTLLARKQLETTLRASEEKFRLLVAAAPVAIIISDQNGQITLVNDKAESLFGYTRNELLAQPVELLIPHTIRARHVDNRAAYISAPRVRQMGSGLALLASRKDGSDFPVEIELSYIETAAGLSVMSFLIDITERKQAEAALREQRDFLQLVINSVPDLITVNDYTGHFRLANERAAHLYGLTPATMIGKTDAEVNPNPAEVAFSLQTDQQALNSEQLVFIPEQTILGRYYQTSKIPLRNSAGEPDRLLVVSADITKHKQAEAALQQTLEKEKELGELKSRFVSMASHEFRTPLASILALTETLQAYRGRLSDQQIEQRLGKIQEQVGHLRDIMEDVLQLARLQARRTEFNPARLDLDALCRSVLEEFQNRPDGHHPIRYSCADTLRDVKLDKKLMRQLITNLVSNALKYSPTPQPVLVQLAHQDQTLVLTVCDQGIGIPAADIKHLFEPFHRAANVGTVSGTGLGLTIAKEAVELHGGSITVESQIEVGTTFTVRIPVATRGE